MTKVNVIDLKGSKVKDIDINDEIFKIEGNDIVLKKAIRLQMNSLRQGTASTKDRSEVSGGGRKPWKQKGTGRARQGSIRAPQWIHGGVVFAPKPRDYRMNVSKTLRKVAITSVLTSKVKDENLLVLDSISFNFPKTKEMVKVMNNFNIESNMLLVTETSNKNVYRSSTNLQNVKVIPVNNINVYDLLKYDKLVMTQGAVRKLEEVYSNWN